MASVTPSEALHEVTEHTLTLARFTSDEVSENGFRRMHIRVPDVRAAAKFRYIFRDSSRRELIMIWDFVWNQAEWYEVAHQALYHYQGRAILDFEWDKIRSWADRVDCWEHSDDLSKILATVVEDNPDWALPAFESWNVAKSPWKRRQSVVGLMEYARKRRRFLPFRVMSRFVDALLADEDYYVQKGVGWTLREIYDVYPAEALEYLERNIAVLSAVAYPAATAKLDKAEKARLKLLRREAQPRTSPTR